MPATQNNENVTQNLIRAFTKRGTGPTVQIRYAGPDEQYLMVGDISRPDRGGINAINVNDPRRRGLYVRTGITVDAPDIPSNTITLKQKIGGVAWYKFRLDCPISIFESEALCNDPGDPLNGWTTLSILSRGLATDKSYKGRTPFDGSDESQAEIGFSWLGDCYTIGGITLGETASVDVTTEVIDIVYADYQNCAECGVPNDGTRWLYALQQTAGGSSAVLGKVLYSLDYGATWTASAITGLGVGALVTAIAIVGQYLVVVVKGENAYYISPINVLTGAPGTWTKITTGFVAAKTPNDIYVESPNRVYLAADGGYIYVSTSIAAGVSVLSAGGATTVNLNRIHGLGRRLVAVSATNTIIKSDNQGRTWVTTTASVTGAHTAVAVASDLQYWVGGASGGVGYVSYTENGGETWTQLVLPGAALTTVQDIIWATNAVGYIAATRTGPTAVMFRSFDEGASWAEAGTSLLPSIPTFGRANRLAVPNVPDPQVAANNVAAAGLSGGLTDGIILIGSAAVL